MITIYYERSRLWCHDRALETGDSYDREAHVSIDPADLSKAARLVLLDGAISYPAHVHRVGPGAGAIIYVEADTADICPDDLSAAILTANRAALALRAENDVNKRKLADAQQRQVDDQAIAKRILGPRLDAMTDKRDILAELVLHIDRSSLHDAVDRLAADRGKSTADNIRAGIEAAVPDFFVFKQEEEEGDA